MKLFGKDVSTEKVMTYVAERLEARGLVKPAELDVARAGVEPRVDPLTFYLSALEANADATRGLPLETHRDGLGGRAVLLAKKMFRAAGQVFINEALGRQRVFNGHVRDSYAQLASEVLRLRDRVAELEAQGGAAPALESPAASTGERGVAVEPGPAPRPGANAGKAAAATKRAAVRPGRVKSDGSAAKGAKPEPRAVRAAVAGEARPGAPAARAGVPGRGRSGRRGG